MKSDSVLERVLVGAASGIVLGLIGALILLPGRASKRADAKKFRRALEHPNEVPYPRSTRGNLAQDVQMISGIRVGLEDRLGEPLSPEIVDAVARVAPSLTPYFQKRIGIPISKAISDVISDIKEDEAKREARSMGLPDK